MIRLYINDTHDDWEDLLEPLRFAYCNSIHSSTHETPFFLVHGRDPVLLIDVFLNKLINKQLVTPQDYRSQLIEKLGTAFRIVKDNLRTAREQFKVQYDKRIKEFGFKAGDKVLLDIRVVKNGQGKKFTGKYEGPYRIVKVLSNGVATILGDGTQNNVNVCRLRPLHDTHVWKDEDGESYSEIPNDRLPRTRNQSTSTSDLLANEENLIDSDLGEITIAVPEVENERQNFVTRP